MSRIAIATLFLLSTLSAIGQSDMDERRLRFGLMASPNFGWLQPNIKEFEKSGLQPRVGFSYGVLFDMKFMESSNFLFSSGLQLSGFGGGLIEPFDTVVTDLSGNQTYYIGKVDRTYRMRYITMPLLLKMRTNEIGYMTYFGAIGMDMGFRTRARVDNAFTYSTNVGPADEKDLNFDKYISFLKLGLNVTVGGEYNLSGNTNAYIGIGWHNSFTNLFRNKNYNRILKPDADGYPQLNSTTGFADFGPNKKAVANYVSLDLGIFF